MSTSGFMRLPSLPLSKLLWNRLNRKGQQSSRSHLDRPLQVDICPSIQVYNRTLVNSPQTRVWSLGQEDALEKGMATHSSILAWDHKETGTTEWLTLSLFWTHHLSSNPHLSSGVAFLTSPSSHIFFLGYCAHDLYTRIWATAPWLLDLIFLLVLTSQPRMFWILVDQQLLNWICPSRACPRGTQREQPWVTLKLGEASVLTVDRAFWRAFPSSGVLGTVLWPLSDPRK